MGKKEIMLFGVLFVLSALTSPAFASPVPDTGQTKCYNDVGDEIACPSPGERFYGQDANYAINPPSYTKLDAAGNDLPDSATSWSMVRDNVTGLIWEVKKDMDGVQHYDNPHDADNTYTWYDPSDPYPGTPSDQDTDDFLDALNSARFGGFNDWRLPTIKELAYLVDYSIPYPGPTINTTYFPNTVSSDYWSSTTYAQYTAYACYVYFNNGDVSWSYKPFPDYVRAVRGGEPPNTFVDNMDGTVTDTSTGLMWQQDTARDGQGNYDEMTWEEALAYCETRTLGGHTDWRLPTIKELRSLVDYTQYDPAIDKVRFPNTVSSYYWSSTTYADDTDYAWCVRFYSGYDGWYDKSSYGYYVRAVRGGASGSFGNLDHFVISNISSPQAVGVAFSVTITAVDSAGRTVTSFNGETDLTGSVAVSPISVKFSSGQWTGQVKVLAGGSHLTIKAVGSGSIGTSNSFSTPIALYGKIGGLVKDNRNNPISGAAVTLSLTSMGAPAYPAVQTTNSGAFSFNQVASGNYFIWASYNGKMSAPLPIVVSGNTTTSLRMPLVVPLFSNEKRTVVLVAGFPGSTDRILADKWWPRLAKDYGSLETLMLHDPNKNPGWRILKEKLRSKCLDEGTEIIDCPWDWRVPLEKAVELYLKPAIVRAKKSPGDKVNIIAHSMGGLLVRTYIQGSSYDNDIENFSMVGTPSQGSTNAYYIWEGGDPKKADDLTDGILAFTNFYWKTTRDLFEKTYGLGDLSSLERGRIRPFIQGKVTPLRDLLPTYDFLVYKGSRLFITNSNNVNNTLKNLNKDPARSNLMGKPSEDGKIKTRVYVSDSEKTMKDLDVLMNADTFWTSFLSFYEDGRPAKDPDMLKIGDGTVPEVSTRLPCSEGWAECIEVSGPHSALFKEENSERIVNDLYPGTGVSLAYFSQPSSVSSTLSLSVEGRVDIWVSDPTGKVVGINPETGNVESTLADAAIMQEGGISGVVVNNPADGIYQVKLKGVYDEDYSLSIAYMSEDKQEAFDARGFLHSNTFSFTFTLKSLESTTIVVNHTPTPPVAMKAEAINAEGLKTRLTWGASSGQNVTGYKVYARYIYDPFMSFVGTTADTSFDPGDSWAQSSGIEPRIYGVTAVKSDGSESLFSNLAQNNDRDHDGLTDMEEDELGTDKTKADTDGDGLKDGEEQSYNTNPLVKDTDGDSYNDYAEIQGGSDPLDPQSIPATTRYVEPAGACGGKPPCYTTLQAALNAAADGDTIQAAKTLAPAEPVWGKSGTVSISGGWKTDFSGQDGTTSMYAPKATGGGGVKIQPSVKIIPKP